MKKKIFCSLLISLLGFLQIVSLCHKLYLDEERFAPDIPRRVDFVMIRDYEKGCYINDASDIRELVKRITYVSDHIGEGPDFKYITFIEDHKRVYGLAYDRYGYPKDAINFVENYFNGENRCYAYELTDYLQLRYIQGVDNYGLGYELSAHEFKLRYISGIRDLHTMRIQGMEDYLTFYTRDEEHIVVFKRKLTKAEQLRYKLKEL